MSLFYHKFKDAYKHDPRKAVTNLLGDAYILTVTYSPDLIQRWQKRQTWYLKHGNRKVPWHMAPAGMILPRSPTGTIEEVPLHILRQLTPAAVQELGFKAVDDLKQYKLELDAGKSANPNVIALGAFTNETDQSKSDTKPPVPPSDETDQSKSDTKPPVPPSDETDQSKSDTKPPVPPSDETDQSKSDIVLSAEEEWYYWKRHLKGTTKDMLKSDHIHTALLNYRPRWVWHTGRAIKAPLALKDNYLVPSLRRRRWARRVRSLVRYRSYRAAMTFSFTTFLFLSLTMSITRLVVDLPLLCFHEFSYIIIFLAFLMGIISTTAHIIFYSGFFITDMLYKAAVFVWPWVLPVLKRIQGVLKQNLPDFVYELGSYIDQGPNAFYQATRGMIVTALPYTMTPFHHIIWVLLIYQTARQFFFIWRTKQFDALYIYVIFKIVTYATPLLSITQYDRILFLYPIYLYVCFYIEYAIFITTAYVKRASWKWCFAPHTIYRRWHFYAEYRRETHDSRDVRRIITGILGRVFRPFIFVFPLGNVEDLWGGSCHYAAAFGREYHIANDRLRLNLMFVNAAESRRASHLDLCNNCFVVPTTKMGLGYKPPLEFEPRIVRTLLSRLECRVRMWSNAYKHSPYYNQSDLLLGQTRKERLFLRLFDQVHSNWLRYQPTSYREAMLTEIGQHCVIAEKLYYTGKLETTAPARVLCKKVPGWTSKDPLFSPPIELYTSYGNWSARNWKMNFRRYTYKHGYELSERQLHTSPKPSTRSSIFINMDIFSILSELNGIANLKYGLLFILAASSLTVYSIILAGWSSNSKYAFIGALRSAAQMISYEVAISLLILPIILLAGSLNITMIVYIQSITVWFIFPTLPAAILFLIAMLAETNRTPFDLPEAEAELVAGYNVDYSALPFAMFFLGEYCNMILISVLFCLLFLGGWSLFGFYSVIFLVVKSMCIWFYFVHVRASLPRYRYDQLMDNGWKIFMPIAGGFFLFLVGALISFDALPVASELPIF